MANRASALFDRAAGLGSKPALIFAGQTITFADLARRVCQMAGGLASLGTGKGSHVGLMLSSGPEFIIAQQALFALGAVVTPLNTQYKPREIAHAVACCRLTAIITDAAHAEVCASVQVPVIRVDDAGDGLSLPYAGARSRPLEAPVFCAESDPAMLLLTSATTGKAKGVLLTQGNLAANYDRTPEWLGLDQSAVILCALPLFNTFGLNQGINAMLTTGATMVLLPRFSAADCIAAMRDHGCTFMPAVPTMLQKILDEPCDDPGALRSLRRIMTGGAPVPATLLRSLLRRAPGAEILTGYGLTEGTALVTLGPVLLDGEGEVIRPRSIGRVLDGIELAILDENSAPVSDQATGELAIRGPNVMAGYFQAPADNAVALRDGWLHTGDIGYLDADGFAYIVDRRKDVIIRGGQNIYPADIEEVLYAAGVAEAAVVGRPEPVLGEVPVAFVATGGAGALDMAALLDHCRENLAAYKLPAAIHILPELPKGPTGKILRRALRDAWFEDSGQSAHAGLPQQDETA